MITDEELARLVDPALAVEYALTTVEVDVFRTHKLTGRYDGMQIADWITEALATDAFVEHTDPWWERYGDLVVAYLVARHGLPELVVRPLLSAAMVATFGIGFGTGDLREEPWSSGGRRRTHAEIASGAALYVCGYARALGWEPHHA